MFPYAESGVWTSTGVANSLVSGGAPTPHPLFLRRIPCPYGDSLCRFGDWSFSAPAMLFKSIFEVFRADYRFLQRGFAIRLLPLSLGCKGVFVRKLHFGRPQQHGRRRKGPVPRGSKTTHPESHVLMGIHRSGQAVGRTPGRAPLRPLNIHTGSILAR